MGTVNTVTNRRTDDQSTDTIEMGSIKKKSLLITKMTATMMN